jgi:hypothetical protein
MARRVGAASGRFSFRARDKACAAFVLSAISDASVMALLCLGCCKAGRRKNVVIPYMDAPVMQALGALVSAQEKSCTRHPDFEVRRCRCPWWVFADCDPKGVAHCECDGMSGFVPVTVLPVCHQCSECLRNSVGDSVRGDRLREVSRLRPAQRSRCCRLRARGLRLT